MVRNKAEDAGGLSTTKDNNAVFTPEPVSFRPPIALELEVLAGDFFICQLEDLSQVDFSSEFCFAAKTDEEISLVCPADRVPAGATACDAGWRAFRVAGTLDFSLIGILAKLTQTLADSGVGLFAVSTYNTDYILVRQERLADAVEALRRAGYPVSEQGSASN